MFSFRRKRPAGIDSKEAEIQAVRKDTFKKIEKYSRSTDKLIRLLEEKDLTAMIFAATGGDRRKNGHS